MWDLQHFKATGMAWPVSSDKWKAPLDLNILQISHEQVLFNFFTDSILVNIKILLGHFNFISGVCFVQSVTMRAGNHSLSILSLTFRFQLYLLPVVGT